MMTGMIALILTGLLRSVRSQRSLVCENLALRHQLAVLRRTAPLSLPYSRFRYLGTGCGPWSWAF
jgi:hypothetical protein